MIILEKYPTINLRRDRMTRRAGERRIKNKWTDKNIGRHGRRIRSDRRSGEELRISTEESYLGTNRRAHKDLLPPGPYAMATTQPDNWGAGHVYLRDANDRNIASIWGKPDEKMALINFIIEAEKAERGRTSK